MNIILLFGKLSYLKTSYIKDFLSLLEFMSSSIYYGCMKKYLSHLSAAKVWNIPFIETVFGHKITEADPTHITVSVRNWRLNMRASLITIPRRNWERTVYGQLFCKGKV